MEPFKDVKVVPDETGYRGGVNVETGTLIIPEKIQGWPDSKKDFFLEHEAAHLQGTINEQRADAIAWRNYTHNRHPDQPFAPVKALDYIFKDRHNYAQQRRFNAQKKRSARYVLNNKQHYSATQIKKAKDMLNYAGSDKDVRNAGGFGSMFLSTLGKIHGNNDQPPQPQPTQEEDEGGDTLLYVGLGLGGVALIVTLIVAFNS
jgi:hypothetical protein